MRALQFAEYGPPSVLRVAEVPEPHAGPGRIRIAARASGVTPAETHLRSGKFGHLAKPPHTLGVDAAGVVDEIGPGVTGVEIGDEVFGLVDIAKLGGASADFVALVAWTAKPAALSWAEAGGAAANVETSTRVLDRLGVKDGTRLLIEGAAGGVGTVAIQLAVARGAVVIGTASPGNHALLRSLGALPTTYGHGLADRVHGGVDVVFDCAGSGSLPQLVELAGSPDRVVTIADLNAAAHGVHLSRSGGPGADPQALHGLRIAAELAAQGRFRVPIAAEFPLDEAAAAHTLSETGHAHGKIVLVH